MDTPPVAHKRPYVVSAHGDDREDPWFWLRERDDPAVLAYLEAENAYTDAALEPLGSLRKGLFEEADGGTFFFDEIAETPLAFQAKLLRAIQEKEIRRVGVANCR